MQIIIVDKDNAVVDIIKSEKIEIENDNVRHDAGTMRGLKKSPLVLPDNIEIAIGDIITEEIRVLDKSTDYIYVDELKKKQKEIDELKEENLNVMVALTDVYEMLLGGM